MGTLVERRVPHSIINSEVGACYAGAHVSVVDFALTSELIQVPPTDYPRLEVILRRKTALGEARFIDSPRRSDFRRLGSMFLFPSHHPLEIRGERNHLSIFLCEFTSEALNCFLGEDRAWTPLALQSCLDIHNRQILSSIARLQQELQFPAFASEIMGEALVMQIAVDLGRHFSPSREAHLSSGGLAPRHLRLLLERIDMDGPPPSLADMANMCRMSIRQLTRGFRASKGRSVGEYIAAHRLQRAKDLLMSDHAIKHVAFQLGFRSPNHFATSFRRETGLTPSQFRQGTRS